METFATIFLEPRIIESAPRTFLPIQTTDLHALDSFMQGPLKIWTEHSNCQIHSRGDSKTLIALLIPNIFLIFLGNYFFMRIKADDMTQFDIFHVFVENSVNSELCFF